MGNRRDGFSIVESHEARGVLGTGAGTGAKGGIEDSLVSGVSRAGGASGRWTH